MSDSRTKSGAVSSDTTTTSQGTGILQYAVGRRKRSVARVRVFAGTGRVVINGVSFEDLPLSEAQRVELMRPLVKAGVTDSHDFTVKVVGGGKISQIGATIHGIARCIAKINDDMRKTMRDAGFLTRDPREKERKKVYRRGARRSPQYSKR